MANRRNTFTVVLPLVMAWGYSPVQADEVTYWNGVALDILKKSTVSPPKVVRDLAIMHSAMYDALNAIDRTHSPLFYEPAAGGPASQEAAVAAAAHRSLVELYPTYEPMLNSLFDARLAVIGSGTATTNGVALGQSVAENMLALRALQNRPKPTGCGRNMVAIHASL